MKEIYDVVLKTTSYIEIGDRTFLAGEVVAAFDRIMISNFATHTLRKFARGGQGAGTLITWSDVDSVVFTFDQGVFSLTQLALLSNAKVVEGVNDSYPISFSETLESDGTGLIQLKHTPISGELFLYNLSTGDKITDFTINDDAITINTNYLNVLVRYKYYYQGAHRNMKVGTPLVDGFLELEGKTKLRENQNGQEVTGIIHIPKLKLMSDLVLRLGNNASPQVLSFNGVGFPVGDKRNQHVCEIIQLDENIDADLL